MRETCQTSSASIIFLLFGSGHLVSSEVRRASCAGISRSGYLQRKIPSTSLKSLVSVETLEALAIIFAFAYGQRSSLAGNVPARQYFRTNNRSSDSVSIHFLSPTILSLSSLVQGLSQDHTEWLSEYPSCSLICAKDVWTHYAMLP